LPELRAALVEVEHSLRSGSNTPPHIISTTRLVKAGESFEDQTIKGAHVQFEILEIDIKSETVKLREDGKAVVCYFEAPDKALAIGNAKGVKRDFDQLQERRLKAAKLFDRGLSQAEVARQLKVHRQSASRWHRLWKAQGAKALKKAGRAGRKPRLQPSQLEQ